MPPPPAAPRTRALILVCVADPAVRAAAVGALTAARLSPAPPPFTEVVVEDVPLEGAAGRIEKAYRFTRAATGVVLVSDGLTSDDPPGLMLSADGKELLDRFGERLYATVALAASRHRVTDVDRVLPLGAGADDLVAATRRCLARLAYFVRPVPPDARTAVEVRPIDKLFEMDQYFRLRHQVYSTMCYLSRLIEDETGGLEVDWCDTQAVHFGAFARLDGYEALVGTARLILTCRPGGVQPDLVAELIRANPVIRLEVEDGVLGTRLPVFQSQLAPAAGADAGRRVLADLFDRVMRDDAVVGEVSRVIVVPEYRGRGLSRELTAAAVRAAADRAVSDLLLECLRQHTPVYAGVGFRELGTTGNVYGIYRTMVGMHRSLAAAPAVAPPAPAPVVTA